MTGLEAYDSLIAATRGRGIGSKVSVNPMDAKDLCKLSPGDLVSRHYSENNAEVVSEQLMSGDIAGLGRCEGLYLSISLGAARLPEPPVVAQAMPTPTVAQ